MYGAQHQQDQAVCRGEIGRDFGRPLHGHANCMTIDALFLLLCLLLTVISAMWISGLSRKNQQDWVSLCAEFADSNGLKADPGNTVLNGLHHSYAWVT
jgi:hypothetical protein